LKMLSYSLSALSIKRGCFSPSSCTSMFDGSGRLSSIQWHHDACCVDLMGTAYLRDWSPPDAMP
jgi:hypothetical protein